MSFDEQQLIDESKAGHPEAFGRLVTRYQDRLYNALLRILGSSEDARDAIQDSFVQAFQKLDTFRGDSRFYSWLFRIAYNAAISRKRKSRPTASIDANREASGMEPVDSRPDNQPSHQMEISERQAIVQQALAEIAEEYRTVVVLKEIEGFSYADIAEVVNCPVGTVRSRLHRARQELRAKLQILMNQEN